MNKRVTSFVFVLLAAAACAVSHTPPANDVHAQLGRIQSMVAADTRLAAFLRPNEDGFLREGTAAVSPGFRSAKARHYSDLGASLPASSDGELLVGISQFARLRLSLRLEGARAMPLALDAGRAFYAGIYADTDMVLAAKPDAVEQLLILRSASAPTRFAYRVALPSGLPRARITEAGALAFENAAGDAQVTVPRPYAIDAAGRRRDADLSWDGTTMGIHLDASSLSYPIVLDPAFVTWTWRRVETPGFVATHALAYDQARMETVLFGGVSADATSLDETWVYARDFWVKRSPVISPRPRTFSSMAYDTKHGQTVLFGGANGAIALKDTWTWDGVSWTQKTNLLGPTGRQGAAMAYDAQRERIVLFGGLDLSQLRAASDTWLWDGSSWTLTAPALSPSPRSSCGMAFDEVRNQLVMFGGIRTEVADDTWLWDGTTWKEAHPTTIPPGSANVSMAYDASLKRVVLTLGERPIPGFPPESVGTKVFSWDGTNWNAEASFPGAARARAAMAPASDGGLVLHGGQFAAGQQIFADTWRFTDGKWRTTGVSQPSPRANAALASFPPLNQAILVGGQDTSDNTFTSLSDLWTWTGGWSKVQGAVPPSRRRSVAAFDPLRARTVLFGGQGLQSYLSDTWEWDGSQWFDLGSGPMTSRASAAMAFFGDPARPRMLLHGGFGATDLETTWEWDGAGWTNRAPKTRPTARSGHAMAYDRANNRMVMFGGDSALAPLGAFGDTWLWDGNDWTAAAPPTSPAPRNGHRMTYDPGSQRVLLFGGKTYDGTTQNDLWAWDGTTWTLLTTAGSPPARYQHSMDYDPARSGVFLFGGRTGATDSTYFGDTWFAAARGGGCTVEADCPGAHCVDGVCCDSAKCGPCSACNLTTPGQCTPVFNAQDSDSCAGTSSCDALGRCGPGPGAPCKSAQECSTGFCSDGVCCDSACTGDCVACSADLKEFGASGQCGPAKASTDPRDTCPDDGPAACQRDGQCDGRGKCRLYPPSSCGCDGDHTVTSPQAKPTDCSPYRCEGSRCKTTCGTIRDCALPYQCSRDGLCVPPADAVDAPEGCTCRMQTARTGAAPWLLTALGILVWRARRARVTRRSDRRSGA